ncbi:hypothetical protein ACFL27_01095 [candidate division CSSED10-310 bacterium]|uniref:IF140/IFT172/WDR19 TPR domain-containing protein n=1 Tax=candidate division CSSED10-310 bacterium TaxID=2855610 RepID=A0ABV6YRE0_UNCC1
MTAKLTRKEKKLLFKDARHYLRDKDYINAADVYARVGKLKKAQKLFLKGEAFLRAGEIALQRQKPLEAAEIYDQSGLFMQAATAYEKAGKLAEFKQMLYKQAQHYLDDQKQFLAAEMFEKAGDLMKAAKLYHDSGFLDKATSLYLEKGTSMEAATAMEEYLHHEFRDMSPKELKARVLKCAQLYLEHNKPEKAITLCKHFNFKKEAARILQEKGQWQEAVTLLKENNEIMAAVTLLREHNADKEADLLEADHLVNEGELVKAAELCSQQGQNSLAAGYFSDAGEYEKAALHYEKEEQFQLAAQNFQQAGNLEKALAHFKLSGNIAEASKIAEQLEYFQSAAELYLELGQFMLAGLNYKKAGLENDAISCFQQVATSSDHYFQAQELIIDHFLEQDLEDIAAKKLFDLLSNQKVNKRTVGSFYRLATILENQGKLKEAFLHFENIVSFDINFKDSMERLKKLRLTVQDKNDEIRAG